MNALNDALAEIYNFRLINEKLATAGQPREEQFPDIAAAGYHAVFNIALPTSDNALANEGSIVTRLGMSYFHIPVDFAEPKAEDFQTFCGLMKTLGNRNVFVHCAANMRVSAFIYLYQVLFQNARPSEAEKDLNSIWEPNPVWQRFIEEQLTINNPKP
jgi:protein tyrosine phosphatase (PTP) superfamily phosphohydrolase (DUF442 family)